MTASSTKGGSKAAEIRAAAADALLASAAEDAGAGGLSALKESAAERFRAMGAPIPQDEYWRYLNPAPFNNAAPAARMDAAPSTPSESFFKDSAPLHAVFVNGRFAPDLSSDFSAAGLSVHVLSSGPSPSWAEDLGSLEAAGQAPVKRPFAALNGALATDGLAVLAESSETPPIEIRHLGETTGGVHLRHLVVLRPGAAATVLESGVGAARFSSVIEADLASNSAFNHVRLQEDPLLEQAAAHLFARIGASAQLKSFTLSAAMDKRVIRNESVLWLNGDDGSAHVAGGVIAGDAAQIDNTVFLTHDAERCESRQVFKNVVAATARAIFQGKILVKEGAQKTDGYQISQAVLLDERAAFNAKPELEIYADDVQCSHGSTTGALDETALFYLRSRGVAEPIARALLIEAFLEEAIEEIADDGLADLVRARASDLINAAT